MTSRYGKDEEVSRATPGVECRAWVGWVILALVTVVILGATVPHLQRRAEERLQQRADEQLERFEAEYRLGLLSQETLRAIDEGVEDAFVPVYDAGIPGLLDWHYSLSGRYTEFVRIFVGELEDEIESRLFVGLEERIDAAVRDVGSLMQEKVFADLEDWFSSDVDSVRPGLRADYERILEPMLADTKRRFTESMGPAALSEAMDGVGISLDKNPLPGGLASGLGLAVVRVLVLAIPLPPGIVAAIAARLGFTIALGEIREAAERQGRDNLEQKLTTLVDEEKEKVKSALSSAAEEVRAKPLPPLTPRELQ